MRKIKVLIVAAAFLAVPLLGVRPAEAMRCDESIETACRVVATVGLQGRRQGRALPGLTPSEIFRA